MISRELKRKDRFGAFQRRSSATFRNRHEAGAVMQTDYAGHTVPVVDPDTGVICQGHRGGQTPLRISSRLAIEVDPSSAVLRCSWPPDTDVCGLHRMGAEGPPLWPDRLAARGLQC